MIILWGAWDVDPVGDGPKEDNWMNEIIVKIEHQRESIPSYSKTTVNHLNDGQGSDYNHHVPYNRIANRVLAITESSTRAYILQYFKPLLQDKAEAFGNKKFNDETPFLDPEHSPQKFNDWYNYMFKTICDWPGNIFLGSSKGDNQGRAIDVPINPSDKLGNRLTKARQKYKNALNIDIELNKVVDNEVLSKWNKWFDYD